MIDKAREQVKAIGEKISKLYAEKKIASLLAKKELLEKEITALTVNVAIMPQATEKKEKEKKTSFSATCEKSELLVRVDMNVSVKNICRNIERKLKRNIVANNTEDFQLLYNHLFYFYCEKHKSTLPIVVGKYRQYDIYDYVTHRTRSVINDTSCHVDFTL